MDGNVVAVLKAIGDTIIESAKDAGPMGIPSGHVYAILMGFNLSLSTYQSILAGLEKAGKIRVRNNCIHAV